MNEHQLAGIFLIAASASFMIGATLPILGAAGNKEIFTLPTMDHLLAVSKNTRAWRRANFFMGSAAILLIAGFTLLTAILEAADERILSRLGLVSLLLAAILWVSLSAFRATVTVAAAEETASTDSVPSYYQPFAAWVMALFLAYVVLGCLGLAAYGASLLQTQVVPSWSAWATILIAVATLGHLLLSGDTLPAFHYFPALLIGIVLLAST